MLEGIIGKVKAFCIVLMLKKTKAERCWPSVLSHSVSSASLAQELGGAGASKWEGVCLFLNPQQGILTPRSGQAQSILSIHTNSLQGAGLYLFVKLFTPWSLYEFPAAATTSYHKLSGFTQQEFIL